VDFEEERLCEEVTL
jgi:hypothetical protein